MPKIVAQINEDLKEILKKKITHQVLKRMAIIPSTFHFANLKA